MEFLSVEHLAPFATIEADKAQQMIDDATAIALLAAPCLAADPSTLDPTQVAAVRAVLRGAVLRWNDAGTGAISAQAVGPFSQTLDTRQTRKSMFWPSEIVQLQDICGGAKSGGAFSIDTGPAGAVVQHADICALRFGAEYCSCGAVLTAGLPLYEVT
jgi:hypothetical protein